MITARLGSILTRRTFPFAAMVSLGVAFASIAYGQENVDPGDFHIGSGSGLGGSDILSAIGFVCTLPFILMFVLCPIFVFRGLLGITKESEKSGFLKGLGSGIGSCVPAAIVIALMYYKDFSFMGAVWSTVAIVTAVFLLLWLGEKIFRRNK